MFPIPRRCAELINQSCPTKVKVKVQMAIFCVRIITLKLLKISSWNFVQMSGMIRKCAEKKNCNHTLSSEVIMPLCLFHIVRLCLLNISFTEWRIFYTPVILCPDVVCPSVHLSQLQQTTFWVFFMYFFFFFFISEEIRHDMSYELYT